MQQTSPTTQSSERLREAAEDAEWLRSLVPFLEAHHCDTKRLERIADRLARQ